MMKRREGKVAVVTAETLVEGISAGFASITVPALIIVGIRTKSRELRADKTWIKRKGIKNSLSGILRPSTSVMWRL